MKQLNFDFPDLPQGKICSRCKIWKTLDKFNNNKMGRYGKRSLCKDCDRLYHQDYYNKNREAELKKYRERYHANIEQQRARSRAYRARNPNRDREYYLNNREKLLRQKREYRAQNPEKIRAANRQQYLKNIEQRKAYARRYHIEHRKKRIAYGRRYYAKHQNRLRARTRRYRAEHREKVAASKSRYQKEHPDQIRAARSRRRTRKTQAGGSFTAEGWQALCKKYENCCLCCGADDKPLTVDHVIPVSKNGRSDISNLQPLCQSCNSKKHDRIIDYRPKANDEPGRRTK